MNKLRRGKQSQIIIIVQKKVKERENLRSRKQMKKTGS